MSDAEKDPEKYVLIRVFKIARKVARSEFDCPQRKRDFFPVTVLKAWQKLRVCESASSPLSMLLGVLLN